MINKYSIAKGCALIIRDMIKFFIKSMISLILSLTIILFAVKVTLNFKLLYYFDIRHLNISKLSNLHNNEIKLIYNYIINFINSSNTADFNLPIFPYSLQGKLHFIEVKSLFYKINLLLFMLMILCVLSLNFIKKNYCILNWCSNIMLVICTSIFLLFSPNFDKAFTLFHKITFSNEYWLFDPNRDPVINILPEEYFLHCLILIILIIIILALVLKFMYYKFKKYDGYI